MEVDERNLRSYLLKHSLIIEDERISAQPLIGGALNKLYSVRTPQKHLVVKQALPQGTVFTALTLTRNRTEREAAALREFRKRVKTRTIPEVYHTNPKEHILIMQHAPEAASLLTYALLEGSVNTKVAKNLGTLYAELHSSTYKNALLKKRFPLTINYRKLKLSLFHREILASTRNQLVRKGIREVIERTERNKVALIHGDAQPKNILIEGDTPHLVDFELSVYGDPAHDVGNLVAHYLLAAIINYPLRQRYFRAVRVLVDTYAATARLGSITPLVLRNAVRYIPGVLYGRTFGAARASFIPRITCVVAKRIAYRVASEQPTTFDDVCTIIEGEGISLAKNKPLKNVRKERMIF